jgi:arginine decarboxylase
MLADELEQPLFDDRALALAVEAVPCAAPGGCPSRSTWTPPAGRPARLTTAMYVSEPEPAMLPAQAWAEMTRRNVERVPLEDLEGRTAAVLLTPYPPGIPVVIPGERVNATIVEFLRFAQQFNERYPGLETFIHGLEQQQEGARTGLYVNCVRADT